MGTATFNYSFDTREGFTRTEEAGKQSTRRKAARPSGALWKARIPPSLWFGHSTCLFALGLTPPFPKQGSLSTPLETSLQSRGWHWFLSPKFVLWEVKPYSPRVNTEVQGISSQDKMLRPCPHPGRIINSGRTLTLDSRSFYSHPLQSLRLHLQHFTQVNANSCRLPNKLKLKLTRFVKMRIVLRPPIPNVFQSPKDPNMENILHIHSSLRPFPLSKGKEKQVLFWQHH